VAFWHTAVAVPPTFPCYRMHITDSYKEPV